MTSPPPLSPWQQAALRALEEKRFFKLILGGSFTDTQKADCLSAIYAAAGADCIDIAPDAAVLNAVENGLSALPASQARPMVMISLPLDPDPHFRKIELNEPQCILCGLCAPVCPTDAIEMTAHALLIAQPLCYGCGRCPAVCPTDALKLNPIHPDPQAVSDLLAHPLVQAVEIHTQHADPYMWPEFEALYGRALFGKALSLCFRPQRLEERQALEFLGLVQAFAQRLQPDFPLILQIDGEPMSGSDDPQAALPSLQAARAFWQVHGARFPFITVSGGVNAATADYLRQSPYAFISGAGMGTVARRAVWDALASDDPSAAVARARRLMAGFRRSSASAIIEESL
ncbi:MAG: 4Fe-4S dicluster domain-containing protein [Vampirovibrionales bacterium]|nr:4Fe-4S dicluster domain-containing protein [Vampirovibrionales bacterium]